MQKQNPPIAWLNSIPFILMHLAVVGVFFVDFSWSMVGLCAGMYFIRMFGITAGNHRYFAHRTYKMGRVTQFFMALLGTLSVQKGVLWWAAHHRHHHPYSDQPKDLHSPKQSGFWYAHVGWILTKETDATDWEAIPDFAKYPELRWLNRYFIIPCVAMAVGLYATLGWSGFFWGFVLSTVLLWHGTFVINSLAHMMGKPRYHSRDESKNSFILALITLGEGWHNNHHTYMNSTRQGFFWWEIDISYYILRAMSLVGLTWGLKNPPLAKLEPKRISRRASAQAAEELQTASLAAN